MTENKRFEYKLNPQGQWDIIDYVESEEKNAICIYNDLGVHPYSSAPHLCNLLNKMYDENQNIRHTINSMLESERTAIGKSVLKQLQELIS